LEEAAAKEEVAVKEEVEHSVIVVIDLHKKWLELSKTARKGDEFEWTSSELLSGLRSIEWDLQDLEDTVSIVEGSRQKFHLEASDLQARKDFITSTRQQIVTMRDQVLQDTAHADAAGFSTSKNNSTLPSIGAKGQGYGQVNSQEDIPEVDERSLPVQSIASDAADEILGMESDEPTPHGRRHKRKKLCLIGSVLLLLAGSIAHAWRAPERVIPYVPKAAHERKPLLHTAVW